MACRSGIFPANSRPIVLFVAPSCKYVRPRRCRNLPADKVEMRDTTTTACRDPLVREAPRAYRPGRFNCFVLSVAQDEFLIFRGWHMPLPNSGFERANDADHQPVDPQSAVPSEGQEQGSCFGGLPAKTRCVHPCLHDDTKKAEFGFA